MNLSANNDRDMPAALARKGFTVLKDQRTRISVRGETLDIAGVRKAVKKGSWAGS